MQTKYDFVLFENYLGAINHYLDILIIAKMLKYGGNKVAIVKYYDEDKYCKIDEIPLIDIKNKYKRPNDNWTRQPKNKIHSLLCLIRFLYQQNRYATNFLKQIEGLANNYYVGSYHLSMANVFVTKTKPAYNYYFWGLRSSRITYIKKHFMENPILGIKAIIFRHFFINKKNLYFFVSDSFIKDEFIQLGIKKNQLVVRPERMLFDTPKFNLNLISSNFSLLTIGLLRDEKRLELSIDAFYRLNASTMRFIIAGRSDSERFEKKLEKLISDKKNIIRINKFIQTEEYNELIEKSHFVVLCDKMQDSLVTSGTMMDAFLLNRPIIAPNYLPYSYYINKYNVGLLFEPEEKDSLIKQIKHAEELGVNYFISHINKFQNTLLFEKCALDFLNELNESRKQN